MAMDTEIENICCSGGALGADAHWGICAQNNGHKVLHFSFPRHKADTQAGEVIVLSKSQLEEADVHLQRATNPPDPLMQLVKESARKEKLLAEEHAKTQKGLPAEDDPIAAFAKKGTAPSKKGYVS